MTVANRRRRAKHHALRELEEQLKINCNCASCAVATPDAESRASSVAPQCLLSEDEPAEKKAVPDMLFGAPLHLSLWQMLAQMASDACRCWRAGAGAGTGTVVAGPG